MEPRPHSDVRGIHLYNKLAVWIRQSQYKCRGERIFQFLKCFLALALQCPRERGPGGGQLVRDTGDDAVTPETPVKVCKAQKWLQGFVVLRGSRMASTLAGSILISLAEKTNPRKDTVY